MLHQRIDVLDSNDYFLNCTDKLDRHEAVFAKIPIIDAAFQKVSNRKLPRVHRWKRPFINVTKQALLNDCMFFIWKYMEYYDGEKLTKEINPVSFISTTFFICFYFCIFFSLFCYLTCVLTFSNSSVLFLFGLVVQGDDLQVRADALPNIPSPQSS